MTYNNKYIGNRYVPKFFNDNAGDCEWTQELANTTTFESLIIVTYQGDSYTSKQIVPAGIPITNTQYWVKTGNFNAQLALYMNEVINGRQGYANLISNFEDKDTKIASVTTQSLNTTNGFNTQIINAKYPPLGLTACKLDGITDDTTAFQALINYSANNNYVPILINGTLKITSALTCPQSLKMPKIIGVHPLTSAIDMSTITTGNGIKFKGVSGASCFGTIEDINFIGNNSITAICLSNCDTFKIKRCHFSTFNRALLLSNEDDGWTEYDTLEDCSFDEDVSIVIEYQKNGTQFSFHGSGLKGCEINQATNEINSKIVINANCLVYNAPLSLQCWTRNSVPLINALSNNNSFYGEITIEPIGAIAIAVGGTNKIFYDGHVMANNVCVTLGTLLICKRISQKGDGSILFNLEDLTQKFTITKTANPDTIIDFSNIIIGNPNGMTFIVDVYSSALPSTIWEYDYTLLIHFTQNDSSGNIVTLANSQQENFPGWGGLTFSLSNYKLQIANTSIPTGTALSGHFSIKSLGSRQGLLV